jgi:glucokinase
MIGIGLANLIVMYAPDVIALGGGLMQRLDLFLPIIRETIANRCTLVPAERTRLAPSRFSADSSLVGAAVVWAHQFQG